MPSTAVWDVSGYPPLPLRWVLVVDLQGRDQPAAFFSTNLALDPQFIVETFVARWSPEVTFKEARAHLGLQSQRHWSKSATQKTTPVILALFSITGLIAHELHQTQPLSPRSTTWYRKSKLTFSDLLEQVRYSLWQSHPYLTGSTQLPNPLFNSTPPCQQLISLLASSL